MGISDREYVNFSEDHELNNHLSKVGKRETEINRKTLRVLGNELKSQTGQARLKHDDFQAYVTKEKNRLE